MSRNTYLGDILGMDPDEIERVFLEIRQGKLDSIPEIIQNSIGKPLETVLKSASIDLPQKATVFLIETVGTVLNSEDDNNVVDFMDKVRAVIRKKLNEAADDPRFGIDDVSALSFLLAPENSEVFKNIYKALHEM